MTEPHETFVKKSIAWLKHANQCADGLLDTGPLHLIPNKDYDKLCSAMNVADSMNCHSCSMEYLIDVIHESEGLSPNQQMSHIMRCASVGRSMMFHHLFRRYSGQEFNRVSRVGIKNILGTMAECHPSEL